MDIDIDKIKQDYPEYDGKNNRAYDYSNSERGRLKILYRTNNVIIGKVSPRPIPHWVCLCNCGNIVVVSSQCLRNGTQSCGCISREKIIEYNKKNKGKNNRYEIKNDIAIGYTAKNEPFYIDKEDLEIIYPYSWSKDTSGYIISNSCKLHSGNNTSIKLHRLIMGVSGYELKVDHINHDTTDNRKCNLRIVTNQQNCRNRKPQYNNKSGVSGVKRSHNKWTAYVYDKGENICLGQFDTIEEAIEARKTAEKEYYKEYSYDSSINQVQLIKQL